jgi:hypothetical protein
MIHLFLLLLLIALFPRLLLRGIGCLVWAVILLVAVILFLDCHRAAKEPPPHTRSMIAEMKSDGE